MPSQPTMPNAENCTLAELQTAIGCAATNKAHRRMMAMRLLFLDYSHNQVAEIMFVARRTLQIWIVLCSNGAMKTNDLPEGGKAP